MAPLGTGDQVARWCERLSPAITAAFLLVGAVAVPRAVSEEAILIPGATVLKPINPAMPLFEYFYYPSIGNKFHDDEDPQIIDYPQEALASDWAVREGVRQTLSAISEVDEKIVVIGESMGSMVAARVATQLAHSAHPPSTDDIRFVFFVPPELGAAEFFKVGTYIPILNYRVRRLPDSPYPTTIVIGEYDFWSDPPDRPWNVVALLNSVLAIAFVHSFEALADPADVPPQNITVESNSFDIPVTTYFVPTKHLPLTDVLRLVVPGAWVDALDKLLRPIVDLGYRRHDAPGDTRPYLSDGEIHWPTSSEAAAAGHSAAAGPDLTPAQLASVQPQASVVERNVSPTTGLQGPTVGAPAASTELGNGHDPVADLAPETTAGMRVIDTEATPAEPEGADAPPMLEESTTSTEQDLTYATDDITGEAEDDGASPDPGGPHSHEPAAPQEAVIDGGSACASLPSDGDSSGLETSDESSTPAIDR